ncbi:MAG: mannose-1-phosphate guanylyltransferase [Deltaproteobacteria bacterium]|nr:mannose-1-phosphate guanylyltransferase [Deltaproteobacteria bacterium]
MGTETKTKQPWVLILAGGSGQRFWPASRRENPKHVLPGLGGEGRSLLQATIDRVLPMTRPERIFVVTSADQAKVVRPQMGALDPGQIILEPEPKNTGPAVALALVWLSRAGATAHDPVLVLPADAWVDDEEMFRATLLRASAAAQQHKSIVTVGITPTTPATGYGWIELGEETVEVDGAGDLPVRAVGSFVEKPAAETAAELLEAGNHLWNAGIFGFRMGYLWWLMGDLDEQWDLALTMISACLVDGDHVALQTEYGQFESISLDHGVIERAPSLLCVQGSFGWSDLGSWDAIAPVLDSAPGAQARAKAVFAKDAADNVVFAPGRTVALLGVSDLVVVVTEDAVLVTPRDRSQEVRHLVEAVGAAGEEDLL